MPEVTSFNNLQQEINDQITNATQRKHNLNAQIAQKEAAIDASLIQADWYEEQAAIFLEKSKASRPQDRLYTPEATWIEERRVKGKSGKLTTVHIFF